MKPRFYLSFVYTTGKESKKMNRKRLLFGSLILIFGAVALSGFSTAGAADRETHQVLAEFGTTST